MQDISPAITSLLYEHDCVIVPGLGAFLSRRVGAAFDEKRGLLLPPRKEVVFNADIVHTDGLLADYICSTDGVAYAEAQQRVEAFVADVRQRLASGSIVMLADMGSLSMADGRIRFEAASNFNVLIESYGLAPVAAERVRPDFLEGFSTPAVRKAVASVAAVAVLLLVTPRTTDQDYVRADFSQAFTASAAAAVAPAPVAEPVADYADGLPAEAQTPAAALALENASVVSSTPSSSAISSAAATVAATGIPSPEAPTSALALAHASAKAAAAAQAAAQTAAPAPEETIIGERFYLVVASFLSQQEARDYIASQRARGITDLQVLDYGGRCRVVAASFPNMSEAQSGNRDLQTVAGFEKSWVLRVPITK